MSSISESDVTGDVIVAAVAAGCTVALHLGLSVLLDAETSVLVRLLPLAVYFLYTFVGRGAAAPFDTARSWSLLTVAVTACVALYYLVV